MAARRCMADYKYALHVNIVAVMSFTRWHGSVMEEGRQRQTWLGKLLSPNVEPVIIILSDRLFRSVAAAHKPRQVLSSACTYPAVSGVVHEHADVCSI